MIKRLFNPSITLDFLIGHAFCDYPLLSNAPTTILKPQTAIAVGRKSYPSEIISATSTMRIESVMPKI